MNSAQSGGGHPDLVAIEAVRTGEGSAEDARHIEQCARCGEILADLERLATELREAADPVASIPEAVDRAILWEARKAALRSRRAAPRRLRLAGGLAAAAVLLLALGTVLVGRDSVRSGAPAVRLAGDVNEDGAIDILDAYELALALEGEVKRRSTDFNGDGKIDRQDVDAIARHAVSVQQEAAG